MTSGFWVCYVSNYCVTRLDGRGRFTRLYGY